MTNFIRRFEKLNENTQMGLIGFIGTIVCSVLFTLMHFMPVVMGILYVTCIFLLPPLLYHYRVMKLESSILLVFIWPLLLAFGFLLFPCAAIHGVIQYFDSKF